MSQQRGKRDKPKRKIHPAEGDDPSRPFSHIGRGPRTSRCYSELHTTPASRAAEMVCLHLERGAFAQARAVIDWYEREQGRQVAPSVAERISTPLAQLVSARLANLLEAAGCVYVDDLVSRCLGRVRLLGLPGVGPTGLAELEAALDRIGLPDFFETPAAEQLVALHDAPIEKAGREALRRRRARGHEG